MADDLEQECQSGNRGSDMVRLGFCSVQPRRYVSESLYLGLTTTSYSSCLMYPAKTSADE